MPLPVSLNVAGRLAVIIGGGAVASRKLRTLLDAGANVRVIAPEIQDEIHALAETVGGRLYCDVKTYEPADIHDAFLVIVATNEETVNARAVEDARAAKSLVLDATTGERGDVAMLASGTIGDITIAIDSGKSTPAFARRIVRDAQALLGDAYGHAARLLAHARIYVQATLEPSERAAVLRKLSELPVEELAAMNPVQIEHALEAMLEEKHNAHTEKNARRTVVCATRASRLALTQSRTVAAQLAQRGIATKLLQITTTGDTIADTPIHAIGAENVFVKELEIALREKQADYAVHSCKDLPSELTEGMHLAAISVREDARDVFCSEMYASFALLPPGSRVGTSSPRRQAQLHALRSDLRYEEMRGNVDTRLRKLREGEYDAIVLAMAGLNRLNVRPTHAVPFEIEQLVPAAAQGALAVETREDDAELAAELRAAVNDEKAELCVLAERAALRELHGGCRAPIGIHAFFEGGKLRLVGAFGHPEGIARGQVSGDAGDLSAAEALGKQLARALRERLLKSQR